MNRLARPAAVVPALAVFAAFGLAGCGAIDRAPIPIEEGAGEPVPDESAGRGDDGLTTDVGGACLVGNWQFSQEQLQGFYTAASDASGVDITIDGTAEIEFTETTYEYRIDFTLSFPLPDLGEVSGAASGSVSGDYTAADGVITTVHDESDVTLTADLAGKPIDLSDLENEIISEHPVNEANYHCEDGAPVIDFVIPDGTHPVRLTPIE